MRDSESWLNSLEMRKRILDLVDHVDEYDETLEWHTVYTPPNSEIICVQNVGAKVEMVSYLEK